MDKAGNVVAGSKTTAKAKIAAGIKTNGCLRARMARASPPAAIDALPTAATADRPCSQGIAPST